MDIGKHRIVHTQVVATLVTSAPKTRNLQERTSDLSTDRRRTERKARFEERRRSRQMFNVRYTYRQEYS